MCPPRTEINKLQIRRKGNDMTVPRWRREFIVDKRESTVKGRHVTGSPEWSRSWVIWGWWCMLLSQHLVGWGRQISEFETSLVNRLSSQIAKVTNTEKHCIKKPNQQASALPGRVAHSFKPSLQENEVSDCCVFKANLICIVKNVDSTHIHSRYLQSHRWVRTLIAT